MLPINTDIFVNIINAHYIEAVLYLGLFFIPKISPEMTHFGGQLHSSLGAAITSFFLLFFKDSINNMHIIYTGHTKFQTLH
jgi:hypothetical protein